MSLKTLTKQALIKIIIRVKANWWLIKLSAGREHFDAKPVKDPVAGAQAVRRQECAFDPQLASSPERAAGAGSALEQWEYRWWASPLTRDAKKVKLSLVAVLKIITVCAVEADTFRRILSYLFFPSVKSPGFFPVSQMMSQIDCTVLHCREYLIKWDKMRLVVFEM